MTVSRIISLLATIAVVFVSQAAFAQQSRPIPQGLVAQMAGEGQASYLVVLKNQADLSAAAATSDRLARGRFVYQALKNAADSSQRPLLAFLAAERAAGRVRQVKPFFSVNAIGVTSSEAALRRLASFPEVDQIIELPTLSVPQPMPGTPQAGVQNVEWNVAKVRAPDVWARGFTGQGIVVASLDTGVEFTHPALVTHYRGNTGGGTFNHHYNWWDATTACPNAPCDDNQHGTHTTGTMVGDDGSGNQIGVAPGATWIACKALSGTGVGFLWDLLECGDWILAPWDLQHLNPNPDLRPHIVNNSWGLAFGGYPFLGTMVANWRAAGIFPAFSAGNSGPDCGTATSPGDYTTSFATGASDIKDVIASFSSRGPSIFGGVIKPDVTAPGVNVRSSVPGNGYAAFSGTSMASPHTAGVVALLWSEFPSLARDITGTERKLRPGTIILNTAQGCGGLGATEHPNNTFGWGRLDAVQIESPFPVYTSRSVYQAGDLLRIDVSLVNPTNAALSVDAYFGLSVGNQIVALIPYGTIALPPSLKLFDLPQVSYTLTGAEPAGDYLSFTLLAQPGSDITNPANIINFDVAPFQIQ